MGLSTNQYVTSAKHGHAPCQPVPHVLPTNASLSFIRCPPLSIEPDSQQPQPRGDCASPHRAASSGPDGALEDGTERG